MHIRTQMDTVRCVMFPALSRIRVSMLRIHALNTGYLGKKWAARASIRKLRQICHAIFRHLIKLEPPHLVQSIVGLTVYTDQYLMSSYPYLKAVGK